MVTKNVCAFLVLSVLAGFTFTGCGSPYSAEYKIVTDGNNAYVETTIKGPAANLAVILTGPSGKSETAIVEKNRMISNCQTARCYMQDVQEGKWVLTVKTVDPEKVVWQKEIALSLGQLTVKDVVFGIRPFNGWTGDRFRGYEITGIRLVLQNTGNMPIVFTGNSFTLRNEKASGFFAARTYRPRFISGYEHPCFCWYE